MGVLLALSAAGIPIGALGVLGGALGVGIGLGLQKLAANYVSGFVILAERSLRIGDMVKVDGFEGRITDISTRYTVIRALERPRVDRAQRDADHAARRELVAGRPQGVDQHHGAGGLRHRPRRVDAAPGAGRGRRCRASSTTPAPGVTLLGFGADGLDLEVGFWILDPQNGQGNVRSDVNLAILRTLNEAGVEIPYPQRVVRNADQASRA